MEWKDLTENQQKIVAKDYEIAKFDRETQHPRTTVDNLVDFGFDYLIVRSIYNFGENVGIIPKDKPPGDDDKPPKGGAPPKGPPSRGLRFWRP